MADGTPDGAAHRESKGESKDNAGGTSDRDVNGALDRLPEGIAEGPL